jgi:single-stranded-DNA-specific exonuclease
VGVAYKIIEYLYTAIGEGSKAERYLDLVALGIVADIAILKGDTRFLLQRGLEVLRSSTRVGLQAIMELAEINPANITEEHIAFILAPRLNALGRLGDANRIVELLTTTNIDHARLLALEIEGMNAQRKLLTDQVYQGAIAQLNKDPSLREYPVLVLAHPAWPAGIVGIVASRLVEEYNRPVILLSCPPGGDARGSARSIESINITATINENQEYLKGFGGHPMAAGLVMAQDCIPGFREAISRTVQEMGVNLQQEKSLQIDGYLTLPELTLELVQDLERLAPYGAGNPPLVMATRNLNLTGYAVVGRTAEHLQLTVEDELGYSQRCIWWQGAGKPLPETPFDLAYSVRASTFRGGKGVQIEWLDYRIVPSTSTALESDQKSIDVIDFRKEINPLVKINHILKNDKVTVWGEALQQPVTLWHDRFSIRQAENLAIWTIPPGLSELQSVIKTVKPKRVYLFAIDPCMDEPVSFLKRLLGLIKYGIKTSGGIMNRSDLAAATAQSLSAINAGIDWLVAHGYLRIISNDGDRIHLEKSEINQIISSEKSDIHLSSALRESAAFRRYYLKADKDHLINAELDICY